MMGLHIIITGNPVNGFRYIGPFKTADHAIDAAERFLSGVEADWWIAPLEGEPREEVTA